MPSGTSRELAETLAEVRTPDAAVPLPQLEGPVEARGTEVAGTQIHSVRLPSFVVTTEIVFGGAGERLVMRMIRAKAPIRIGGTLGDPQGGGRSRRAPRIGRPADRHCHRSLVLSCARTLFLGL